jgi:hypothetical protein
MSQFSGDATPIVASSGSLFFRALGCEEQTTLPCVGTAEQWIDANFPDWSADSVPWNALYMVVALFATRIICFLALTGLDYRAN